MPITPESVLLTDRLVLVTGAAQGIGAAVAIACAQFGADVAICDRDAAGLAAVGAEITAAGRRVLTGEFDVRDGDAVRDWVATLGPVTALVNNAGGGFRAEFADVNDKGQDSLIRENFTSVTNFVRACVPQMPNDGSASITNITSIEAHRAAPGFAVYSAMKAAVANLTKTLALELGGRLIRVNCIAPDVIPTPGVGEMSVKTPLPVAGHVDDIAGAVVYLASPLGRFVTGTTLHVDGGNLAAGGWHRDGEGVEHVKFGIALGALNPHFHLDATLAAEEHGWESVWLPEHLVFTRTMTDSPHPGEDIPPVPPTAPIYDAFAYLGYLAGRTERLRLGTHVYNVGLRHPFTVARGVQTLDILSGGRFEFGIGASWLREEWVATELDFDTRAKRVDEVMAVCKQLWTDETISHHGEFFSFDQVVFEPKPVQKPWPPILVGGESKAALRRAARLGDGWIGMGHSFESAEAQLAVLRDLLAEHDRDPSTFQFIVGGAVTSTEDVKRWEGLGITRMVISPWRRSPEAVDAIKHFGDAYC